MMLLLLLGIICGMINLAGLMTVGFMLDRMVVLIAQQIIIILKIELAQQIIHQI